MRLDVFLKASRLVKRRQAAKDLCDLGRVRMGGAHAKPGREVGPGDVITLRLAMRVITVEVAQLPAGNVPKALAAGLYRVLSDEPAEDDGF